MRARCARTCSSARSSLVKIVNSFIGSTAFAAMNDSTTASCATATRETQSRFGKAPVDRRLAVAIERHVGDRHEQPLLDVEQADRPAPASRPARASARGRRSAATTQ